jgi:hypothetical protein
VAITVQADRVRDALLRRWADKWRPHLPDLPTEPGRLARAASWFDDRPALWRAFDVVACRVAEEQHPEHAELRAAPDTAQHAHEQAWHAPAEGRRRHDERLAPFGSLAWIADPEGRLAQIESDIATTAQELTAVQARITELTAEPALLTQPADRLAQEHAALARPTRRRMGRAPGGSPTAVLAPTDPQRPTAGAGRPPDASIRRESGHRLVITSFHELSGREHGSKNCRKNEEQPEKLAVGCRQWPRTAPSASAPRPPPVQPRWHRRARARTAHHHRSRRTSLRSHRHPSVLASPRHRPAQIPPRPARPLPPRRPPQLD